MRKLRLTALACAGLVTLGLVSPAGASADPLRAYAADTWRSMAAMTDPGTGLPADKITGDLKTPAKVTSPTDIGAYNPCFPEYRFDRLDADKATGRVNFPLAYEGPPGLVHGGFLGVFFDCVIQHHNCVTGLSGKTRSLVVTFRRPTPVLTDSELNRPR